MPRNIGRRPSSADTHPTATADAPSREFANAEQHISSIAGISCPMRYREHASDTRRHPIAWLVAAFCMASTVGPVDAADVYRFPSKTAAKDMMRWTVEALVGDRSAPEPCRVHIVPDVRGSDLFAEGTIEQINEMLIEALKIQSLRSRLLI